MCIHEHRVAALFFCIPHNKRRTKIFQRKTQTPPICPIRPIPNTLSTEEKMKHPIHQNPRPTTPIRATQPAKQTNTQANCKCKNRKFHRGYGRRCPAPHLGSTDELCTWCRNGHPDQKHHDEKHKH